MAILVHEFPDTKASYSSGGSGNSKVTITLNGRATIQVREGTLWKGGTGAELVDANVLESFKLLCCCLERMLHFFLFLRTSRALLVSFRPFLFALG